MEDDAGCSSPAEDEEELPEDVPEEDALSEEDEDEEDDWEELLGAASRGQESDVKSITSVIKNAVVLLIAKSISPLPLR